MMVGADVNSTGPMANHRKESGQQENQTTTITENIACCRNEQNGRPETARMSKGSLVRSHLKILEVMSCTFGFCLGI